MRKVTKDEFFAVIGPLDCNPHSTPTEALWRLRNLEIVGKSTPGYLCGGPKEWFLKDKGERA